MSQRSEVVDPLAAGVAEASSHIRQGLKTYQILQARFASRIPEAIWGEIYRMSEAAEKIERWGNGIRTEVPASPSTVQANEPTDAMLPERSLTVGNILD